MRRRPEGAGEVTRTVRRIEADPDHATGARLQSGPAAGLRHRRGEASDLNPTTGQERQIFYNGYSTTNAWVGTGVGQRLN